MAIFRYKDDLGMIHEIPLPHSYTPIRGVDYWTEKDIAMIKKYIDEHSSGSGEGSGGEGVGEGSTVNLEDYSKKTDTVNTITPSYSNENEYKLSYMKATGLVVDKVIGCATATHAGMMSADNFRTLKSLKDNDEGYIKSSDLDNYYTKSEIDSLGVLPGVPVDLSNYYTKDEIDAKSYVKTSTLNDYSKKTDTINTLSFTNETSKCKVTYMKASGLVVDKYIDSATDSNSGVMSASDHKKLTDLISDLEALKLRVESLES